MKRMLTRAILMLAVALSFASSATAQTGPYYATPSWDQTLPCTTSSNCPRFVVLSNFGGDAVLDRETGLVWEKSPSEALVRLDFDPCQKAVGGRQGWRVPTVEELRSLIDPAQSNPSLPPGQPFMNIHFSVPILPGAPYDLYWSVSDDLLNPGTKQLANFGIPNGTGGAPPSIAFGRAWCVRGPAH